MEMPSKAQTAYSQFKMIESMLHFVRDSLENSEFDDLELISHMDKARVMLKCADNRMLALVKKSQEPKSVCY